MVLWDPCPWRNSTCDSSRAVSPSLVGHEPCLEKKSGRRPQQV